MNKLRRVRIAGKMDVPAINAIVDRAVESWDVAERLKRLAVKEYRYRQEDLDHMWLLVAEGGDGDLLGVAALEDVGRGTPQMTGHTLLLHGIYVEADVMGSGVGSDLLRASSGIASALGYDGLLVKAVRQSRGFFRNRGLKLLPNENPQDYPYRYWLPTNSAPVPQALASDFPFDPRSSKASCRRSTMPSSPARRYFRGS